MKNLCYLVGICLFVTGIARAEDPAGVKFFTGSWKAVLAEAKRQNKPVFVDIYTTWCGPCKLMAKQAFPDAKVGETFNANFINYQIDAEKGEGIEVAKKYVVTAYPTSLYVAANGDLIHRAIGYGGIAGLLAEADKAVAAAKDPNSLSSLEKQYADGKRDPAFVAAYLAKRGQIGMPDGKVLDDYLKTIPEADWKTEANLKLIAANLTSPDSKAFDVLLNNFSVMRANPAAQKDLRAVSSSLMMLGANGLRKAKTEEELTRAITTNQQVMAVVTGRTASAAEQETAASAQRRQFYLRTKNLDKYRTLARAEGDRLMAVSMDSVNAKNAVTYKRFQLQTAATPDSIKNRDDFKRYAESMKSGETAQMGNLLNSLAWSYYENMPDTKDLNQALAWSARSLDYDRGAAGLDTYAHLLSKLGRKAEAVKTQEEAIAKTKAAGGDTAEYEKGLTAMKAQQ